MLMRAQIAAEFALAHTHWLPMPPPQPGEYLVRAEIRDEDRKVTMKSVRLDWYDGKTWPRMGGYVSYTGWMKTPGV